MTFFVTGNAGNSISTKLAKTEVTKNTNIDSNTGGKFQSFLVGESASTVPKTADQNLEQPTDEAALFDLEEMKELLHLELSLLNNLEEELVSDEYYQLVEDLIVLSSNLTQETQPLTKEDTSKKLFQLSERVVAFMSKWLDGNDENKEQKIVKQATDIKELMSMIEKKLTRISPSLESSLPNIDSTRVKSNPFPTFLTEGNPISNFSMSQLQQPKQATIQWVVDTTSDQVAREQLIQKLEGILSKSQTRIVNGLSSITIRLNPEHLGTLHIKLQETQQGLVAKLVVHSKWSANLLESGVAGLKQNLLTANINIDKIEIVYQEQEQRFLHQGKDQEEQQTLKDSSANNKNSQEENEQTFEEILLEEIELNELGGE